MSILPDSEDDPPPYRRSTGLFDATRALPRLHLPTSTQCVLMWTRTNHTQNDYGVVALTTAARRLASNLRLHSRQSDSLLLTETMTNSAESSRSSPVY